MSKYIVDIDDFEPMFKVDSIGVFGIGKSVTDNTEEHSWSRIKSLEDFGELNSDYINEHYGQLQDDAYQRGLDDAWEAAKKIEFGISNGGITTDVMMEIFGTYIPNKVLREFTAAEAIEKLKAYEEKQQVDDEIKVGDEVEWDGDRFIVTRIYKLFGDKNHCDGIGKNGCVYNDVLAESLVKTGRTFPLVASIVKEMTK